ncbi:FAD binding domain-containing protein [Biscogniauxia mediterranea]|nr:FAD binding domain-containing protein [Biscogniauxia mediterranea]
MTSRHLIGLVQLLALAAAAAVRSCNATSVCRTIPGDASWPSRSEWDALNQTVSGRLIATVPIAAPCHNAASVSGQLTASSLFNQDACDTLRSNWYFPETHLPSSSSPMAYQFTNNSCNPFLDANTSCTLGYHVAYTINATSVSDIQAAISFVQEKNIRLVIRNTGHCYLGKSTGAHSLAIWTHYMKSLDLIEAYTGASNYTGAAIKIGAGVEGLEAYEFAHTHGLMVVGGNAPTVGIAGGYTQGGGIGLLSSKYGLAADQVLEWEVVTGTGEFVTASATQNSDLFWALRGGGGGTYGVVVSMTVKAHEEIAVSSAYLTVVNNGTNGDAIYGSLGTFLQLLPGLTDAGAWVVFVATPQAFLIMPAMAPGMAASELDGYLKPFLDKLDQAGLTYTYSSADYATYLDGYNFNSATSSWNVSDSNLGNRLIPRSLVSDNSSTEALVSAIRNISSQTIMSGVAFSVAGGVSSPDDVAVNPYFRETLFSATLGTTIDYTDFTSNKAAQDEVTYELVPQLKALTPNGAAYLNEADFQEPDFKAAFYGSHYAKLLSIKNTYDPQNIFYAKTAVGSDLWEEGLDGRLCKK